MTQLLFFAKRWIFESPFARGESASVRAVDKTVRVQNLKVLANRNLRCFETAGEFGDENSALMIQQIEDGAATFFVEHGYSLERIPGSPR
jgi:hypothetical protein